MNLLVDTHVLIWFAEGSPRLSKKAKTCLESAENQIFYSVASIWEMAIKSGLGKLHLKRTLDLKFRHQLLENGFQELSVEYEHVTYSGLLPFHHRDPFDRLLTAQAIVEGFSVVSHDSQLDPYPINRLW